MTTKMQTYLWAAYRMGRDVKKAANDYQTEDYWINAVIKWRAIREESMACREKLSNS